MSLLPRRAYFLSLVLSSSSLPSLLPPPAPSKTFRFAEPNVGKTQPAGLFLAGVACGACLPGLWLCAHRVCSGALPCVRGPPPPLRFWADGSFWKQINSPFTKHISQFQPLLCHVILTHGNKNWKRREPKPSPRRAGLHCKRRDVTKRGHKCCWS